jgi:hypothetical protein
MGLSTPFIRRPVATILLTFGVAAAGALAFFQLPVAPLPQVDFKPIANWPSCVWSAASSRRLPMTRWEECSAAPTP